MRLIVQTNKSKKEHVISIHYFSIISSSICFKICKKNN